MKSFDQKTLLCRNLIEAHKLVPRAAANVLVASFTPEHIDSILDRAQDGIDPDKVRTGVLEALQAIELEKAHATIAAAGAAPQPAGAGDTGSARQADAHAELLDHAAELATSVATTAEPANAAAVAQQAAANEAAAAAGETHEAPPTV